MEKAERAKAREATERRERARERKLKERTRARIPMVKEQLQSVEVGELKQKLIELTHNMTTARAVQEALDKQAKEHEKLLTVGSIIATDARAPQATSRGMYHVHQLCNTCMNVQAERKHATSSRSRSGKRSSSHLRRKRGHRDRDTGSESRSDSESDSDADTVNRRELKVGWRAVIVCP